MRTADSRTLRITSRGGGPDPDRARAAGAGRPRGRLRGRGGRRQRADPAPGAAALAAGRDAGAGAGDQQARLDLRHDGEQRDVLPPGAAGPADLRPADGARVRRLGGRARSPPARSPSPRSTRSCWWCWSWSAAYVLFKPSWARRPRSGSPATSTRRLAMAHRRRDRVLRRRARPGHRQLLRVHAGRAARLQLPRGVGEGPDRQLGDQPGRAVRVRPAGRGAVEGRPGDGRVQPARRLPRRADRGRPRVAVRAGVLHRRRLARSSSGSAARCSGSAGERQLPHRRPERRRPRSRSSGPGSSATPGTGRHRGGGRARRGGPAPQAALGCRGTTARRSCSAPDAAAAALQRRRGAVRAPPGRRCSRCSAGTRSATWWPW